MTTNHNFSVKKVCNNKCVLIFSFTNYLPCFLNVCEGNSKSIFVYYIDVGCVMIAKVQSNQCNKNFLIEN